MFHFIFIFFIDMLHFMLKIKNEIRDMKVPEVKENSQKGMQVD